MQTAIISSKDLKKRWDAHFLINQDRLKDSISDLKQKYTKEEAKDILKILKPKFKKVIKETYISVFKSAEDSAINFEIAQYPYECLALILESIENIEKEVKKTQNILQKELRTIKNLRESK